jgi:hypothetical protein
MRIISPSRGARGLSFPESALREAPRCAAALVKGSRFMAMERVVRALVPQEASDAH